MMRKTKKKIYHRGTEAQRIFWVWGLLWALYAFALPAQALEIRTDVAPMWWYYSEIVNGSSSAANGWNLSGQLSVHQKLRDNLTIELGWNGSTPVSTGFENWYPIRPQINDLKIKQWETFINMELQWKQWSFGIQTAYQWHQQNRSHFIPIDTKILSFEPVQETVKTAWIDLSGKVLILQSQIQLFGSFGLPYNVRTNNTTLIAKPWTTTHGFRASMMAQTQLETLPYFHLFASYKYRELGNELVNAIYAPTRKPDTFLWPKNRFQTISLGASAEW